VIEVRETGAAASGSAVLIRCDTGAAAGGVTRCVDLALCLGHTHVVVDLGSRPSADSDLLAVLHRAGGRVRQLGGCLAVVSCDSRLRRLLDVTLLSQSFAVYATREEALGT
jgi:anti-anti-sigma factor